MNEEYKILFDYRSEGFKFEDGVFANVSDAVKHALDLNYGVPFLIVKVVNWEAKEIN